MGCGSKVARLPTEARATAPGLSFLADLFPCTGGYMVAT